MHLFLHVRGSILRVSPVRSFKVYTRTGDTGTSQLFSGERRLKSDPIFVALGATDELNSHIGLSREYASRDGLVDITAQLEEIMSRLFDVGASIATPLSTATEAKVSRASFDAPIHTAKLEKWIDDHTVTLPPLKNFVLPSGGLCAAQLHVSRSVCRRAEREAHSLVQADCLDPEVARYLNRLSDYLFTAARASSCLNGHPEVIWKK